MRKALLLAIVALCVGAFGVGVGSASAHGSKAQAVQTHAATLAPTAATAATRSMHICTSYCALLVDPWFSGDSFWCGPAHYGDVIFLWGGSVWVCDRSAYYNGTSHVHYDWANPIPAPDGAHWYDLN